MTHLRPVSPTRLLFLAVFALLLFSGAAYAQPSFQMSFFPSTIGPGSTSTIYYTITNGTTSPVTSLAFTNSLPAGMTVADPVVNDDGCQGSLSASTGGTSISYSGGAVGGSTSCTIQVNVTSSTAGTAANTTGDLTSSAGNSGSASANLTVDAQRPGFIKSFSPNPATFNGRVTLTFTIDNSASSTGRVNMQFSDSLPAGMTVASPSNLTNNCGGLASASGSTVSLGFDFSNPAQVAAGGSCTISVDVIAGSVGSLANLTGDMVSTPSPFGTSQSSGLAGDTLDVFAERLALTKTFTDDPVGPGDSVTLQFNLTNLDRRGAVTDINFTDDLDAALSGLVATSLPANPCGSGSAITGTSTLSLTGGTLNAEASCSFSVVLQVPASATSGSYTNTTSSVLGMSGTTTVSGPPASDILVVEAGGIALTKTFVDNPVGAGSSTTLEFTLSNDGSSDATDISFQDVFAVELPTASSVPAGGFCNGTGTANYTPLINPPPPSDAIPAQVTFSGMSLTAGDSCTFSITLDVDQAAAPGIYPNTTGDVTATIDGETATSDGASDDLQIVGGPLLSKSFIDDPTLPGGTVTLEFTIEMQGGDNSGSASMITFTDDLSATLSGLAATGLPAADVCGTGSELSGTTTLSFTGGSLGPGDACTFSVVLDVPAGASAGSYSNTTSDVTSDVDGVATTTPGATDDLLIAGVAMTKSFVDDPTLPGGTVTLEYTITNAGTTAATDITFRDDFNSVIPMMSMSTVPAADSCGTGSTFIGLSGNRILLMQGGNLAAGASCTFSAVLDVPAGAADGVYGSLTSNFFATIDGNLVALENAFDELEVNSTLIDLDKEFLNDPVAPGGMVTLRFTITNLSDFDLSDLSFTDDLDAVIPGMTSASSLTDPCGAGSSFGGGGLLTLTGGMLSGMASCSFDVAVSVPTAVGDGPWVNVTSEITGTAMGLPVEGSSATDELEIASLTLTKAFGAATAEPGDTVSLSFTIVNDGPDTVTDLSFNDDLDAMLSGLEATGLPQTDVCGEGSQIDGLDFLSFIGGSLPPNGSCTFSIDVVVPAFASPGVYTNVTGSLRKGGGTVADPATADLEIIEIVDVDTDGDGVLDQFDVCAGTVIPESVPTVELKPNRYALVDNDFIFDTTPPPGGGGGPGDVFTTTDTGGCSCEQIIVALGLGQGHVKFGCSVGVMRNWVNLVTFGPIVSTEYFEDGNLQSLTLLVE